MGVLGLTQPSASAQELIRPSPQAPESFVAPYPGGASSGQTKARTDAANSSGVSSNLGVGGSAGPDGSPATNAPGSAASGDALNSALAARGDAATGSGGSLGFPVLGDQGPLTARQSLPGNGGIPNPFPPPKIPGLPNGRGSSILAPSVRSYKIAENQSPRPQDRVFYGFNFFDNVNQAVNARLDSPIQRLQVYRNIFGFEKTFLDGQASIGLRLPLYTLTANSRAGSGLVTPTSTSLGDLGIFGKYVLMENKATGSLVSAGLVLTPPSGPSQFAGAKYINSIHSMQFQPFVGYLWNIDKFFIQGFSAIDVPTDSRDVTMFYNDIAFGYVLYRDADPRSTSLVTAIAPTFEVHVNTPLNHRHPYSNDVAGTADAVNLTYGLNVELKRSAVATFGFVTPVSSPKPFDFEVLFLLNLKFGGSRTRSVFPIAGN